MPVHPRVGVGVLVIRNGMVLLGKRIGSHMSGFYASPGGHLENNETFAECARREVFEETGLEVTKISFLTIGNYLLDQKHYVDIDLVAEAPEGKPEVREPEKCHSWNWYPLNDLPSPLFIVTKTLIETYKNGFDPDAAPIDTLFVQI